MSSNRSIPYTSKPSDFQQELLEQLQSVKLLLLQRIGPCVFKIRDDDHDNLFTTTIGNPHRCSCHSIKKMTTDSMCIHILYVLIKILRIPTASPLWFQMSLIDTEINQILIGIMDSNEKSKKYRGRRHSVSLTNASLGGIQREVLNENSDHTCPICYDEISSNQKLTWCRKMCGKNIHSRCMQSYAQYIQSTKQPVLCPLCRHEWDMHSFRKDCMNKFDLSLSCIPIKCVICKTKVKDIFYRCVECSLYKKLTEKHCTITDFCRSCFRHSLLEKSHLDHHFLESDGRVKTVEDVVWIPVKNPCFRDDNSDILRLQHRELSNADYETLLNLDKHFMISLPSHILSSMKIVSEEDLINPKVCVSCQSSKIDSTYYLPCNDFIHRSCLLELITDKSNDTFVPEFNMTCPCGYRIFRGLSRSVYKLKVKTTTANAISRENTTKLETNDTCLPAITGISFHNDANDSNHQLQISTRKVATRRLADTFSRKTISRSKSMTSAHMTPMLQIIGENPLFSVESDYGISMSHMISLPSIQSFSQSLQFNKQHKSKIYKGSVVVKSMNL